jgi:hypothetical protein
METSWAGITVRLPYFRELSLTGLWWPMRAGAGRVGSGLAPGWCGCSVLSLLWCGCGGAVCWRPAICLPTQFVVNRGTSVAPLGHPQLNVQEKKRGLPWEAGIDIPARISAAGSNLFNITYYGVSKRDLTKCRAKSHKLSSHENLKKSQNETA